METSFCALKKHQFASIYSSLNIRAAVVYASSQPHIYVWTWETIFGRYIATKHRRASQIKRNHERTITCRPATPQATKLIRPVACLTVARVLGQRKIPVEPAVVIHTAVGNVKAHPRVRLLRRPSFCQRSPHRFLDNAWRPTRENGTVHTV